jgi:4-hydroxybenzoate polyprenyltransferase
MSQTQATIAPTRSSLLGELCRALRPVQWAKNVLLAVPLLAAHEARDYGKLAHVVLAIAAFSLAASAAYIINDLLDRTADRLHPIKRDRPFASGRLSASTGLLMALGLLVMAAVACGWLPPRFGGALGLYVLAAVAYSLYFKRKLILDVIVLAGFYTLRIIAGGVATGVPLSVWLLAFSMFFFLSLAFVKRFAELRLLRDIPGSEARGRGYMVSDLDVLRTVGPASGYLAVLVLCLYINDRATVGRFYREPHFLWLVCPLLLYWITRMWFLAQRGWLHDDPLVFALQDRASYFVGFLTLLVLWLATVWPWPI